MAVKTRGYGIFEVLLRSGSGIFVWYLIMSLAADFRRPLLVRLRKRTVNRMASIGRVETCPGVFPSLKYLSVNRMASIGRVETVRCLTAL